MDGLSATHSAPRRSTRLQALAAVRPQPVYAPPNKRRKVTRSSEPTAVEVEQLEEALAEALTQNRVLREQNDELREEMDEEMGATARTPPNRGAQPDWLEKLKAHAATIRERNAERRAASAAMRTDVAERQGAMKVDFDGWGRSLRTVTVSPNGEYHDLGRFLDAARPIVADSMDKTLTELHSFRANLSVEVQLKRKSNGDVRAFKFFSGGAQNRGERRNKMRLELVLTLKDVGRVIPVMYRAVRARLEDFLETHAASGSDWVLDRINWAALHMYKWTPNAGASFFKLTGKLKAKKACINVENKANDCFEMSVLAALHPAPDNVCEARWYTPYKGELDLSMFEDDQPVPLDTAAFEEFERVNHIAIHVWHVNQSTEQQGVTQVYHSTLSEQTPISLLLVEDDAYEHGHWVYVKRLSVLLHESGKDSYDVCTRCLRRFTTKADELAQHKAKGECFQPSHPIVLPKAGTVRATAAFRDWSKLLPLPFVTYYSVDWSVQADGKMVPAGVKARFVSRKESVQSVDFCASGDGCLEALVERLDSWAKRASFHLQSHRKLVMSAADEARFQSETECWFCEGSLPADRSMVHRHHCHVSGVFLGASCAECNVNGKVKYTMPCFSHDAKHVHPLLLAQLGARIDNSSILPRESSYMRLTADGARKKLGSGRLVREALDLEFKDSRLFLPQDIEGGAVGLAQAFEAFRNSMTAQTRIDPAHELSLPSATYQACLLQTGARLDVLTDGQEAQFEIFNSARRGGIVQCSKRYARANNPRCPDYDPAQPTSWIVHLDVNGLYPWAMTQQAMPKANYRLDDPETWPTERIMEIADDAPIGYHFVVDCHVPEHLHDALAELPPAPHVEAVADGEERLLCSLRAKERYSVHYRALQTYMRLGMVVTKVHSVMSFDQSPWIAPYVERNHAARVAAASSTEKEHYKLLNNSLYGAWLLDPSNYRKVQLFTREKERAAVKLLSMPHVASDGSAHKLSEDLLAVEFTKPRSVLNRPWPVGLAVQDISKARLYELFYGHVKKLWPQSDLLYVDTDSLVLHVRCEDPYKDMAARPNLFHPTQLGLLKDECKGQVIAEFIGLRSKSYSELFADGSTKHKASGVMADAVAKEDGTAALDHERYRAALAGVVPGLFTQSSTRIVNGAPVRVTTDRRGFSSEEVKRVVLEDGVRTLPLGHYKLRQ